MGGYLSLSFIQTARHIYWGLMYPRQNLCKGHIGTTPLVPHREVVCSLKVMNALPNLQLMHAIALKWEVIYLCPLFRASIIGGFNHLTSKSKNNSEDKQKGKEGVTLLPCIDTYLANFILSVNSSNQRSLSFL